VGTEEAGASQATAGTQPSTSTGAVFLSYASEDAAAAEQIASALRAAGIAVWFDKSELRGGDVWDRMIRQRIRDCALFIPVISGHTQERLEGYFRLEWKLAVDRSQRMAAERTFIVPVVVDATRDRDALVPDFFHEVQLTRLPRGETPMTPKRSQVCTLPSENARDRRCDSAQAGSATRGARCDGIRH
jgi:hypothetical protein